MQQFSIKSVERLSGIKAHTLRVWEQRYQLIKPARKDSNHRFYSNEDLKILLRIVYLYHKGYRISEIARLTLPQIQGLLTSENSPVEARELAIMELTEAILDFDEVKFDNILSRISVEMGFEKAILHVVFPLLNKMGNRWMTDQLIPGQEHFASNIIARKIIYAVDRLGIFQAQRPGKVMLFTPEGEEHEIGLLFMWYLLKKNGYHTRYLGVGTPDHVIEQYYKRHQPTHFYVHLTSNLQGMLPWGYLKMLCLSFPETVIVAGGTVVKQMEEKVEGCRLLLTDKDMLDFSHDIGGKA